MEQDGFVYENYKTVWATVKPFKANDASILGKKSPEATHKFYIRYRKDIEPDMRIVYRGCVFRMVGPPVDIDEAHELLEIQAEERVDKE